MVYNLNFEILRSLLQPFPPVGSNVCIVILRSDTHKRTLGGMINLWNLVQTHIGQLTDHDSNVSHDRGWNLLSTPGFRTTIAERASPKSHCFSRILKSYVDLYSAHEPESRR